MAKKTKAAKRPTIGQLATEAVQKAEAIGDVRGVYEELHREVRVEQEDKGRRYAALEILFAGLEKFWKSYTHSTKYDAKLLDTNPLMQRAAELLKTSRARHLKPVFGAIKSIRKALQSGMADDLGDLESALTAVVESYAVRRPGNNDDLPF